MTRQDLKALGFRSAGRIISLRKTACGAVDDVHGVYAIVRPMGQPPGFNLRSTMRFNGSTGRDAAVALSWLESRWVPEAEVLYIGKAARADGSGVRSRLREYLACGAGQVDNHWGGRLIWQLRDAENLLVYWRPHEKAHAYEKWLIYEFTKRNNLRRPFTNAPHLSSSVRKLRKVARP